MWLVHSFCLHYLIFPHEKEKKAFYGSCENDFRQTRKKRWKEDLFDHFNRSVVCIITSLPNT